MTNIQKLNYELNKQVKKQGLVNAKVKVEEYEDAKRDISACIDPRNWEIKVTLKSNYEPIQDSKQKAYAKLKKIENGLETMVLHIGGLHEVAHWELPLGSQRGCPFDTYNHDKILEATKNGLPENKKENASYLANAFEDTIINPRCKEYNKDFSGQILFWDSVGADCKKQGKKYPNLYEAFVKVNLHLFGDKYDKSFLKRNYTNDKKVEKAVKQIISELNLEENIQDTSVLFQKQNWPAMAEKYAKVMSELLDDSPKLRLSAFDSGESQEGQGEKKEKSGNGIEQKVNSKEGKEQIAYGRYSSGEKQSPNFESFEQLDALYMRLAKDIPVKVEAMTKENSLEISPLNYRPFDSEKDNPVKIKTSKFFFNENGFNLAHPKEPLTINYNSKVQRKSFPDFKMVVVDNSGSMNNGINGNSGSKNFIPWGDNSKYHWALIGYYGIENFLQKQGISPYIEHGVSLFSDATRLKKGNYNDLINIRKLLLCPDWGNTHIDAKVLKEALNGKESFLVSLSDGEIGNWDSEKAEIKKLAEQNYYAHIQIGSETEVSKDLISWGVPVYSVNSGKDISKLMVDITKKTYNRFIKSLGAEK